ncbi:hypothetical protein NMG46_26635 [Mesorhizobium sp. LMG 17147]|uniref:hypothetical protein n=1 Tax=Mesorhizobium sp. LMG 17147 TaxID=2963091 RepID=UPI0020C95F21|nr:hypothetical protein [Mesorhizobium sp. LMG 17147]MCP9233747.1 hypothetical protein [Mesorhizobium sp. LMG 17147]
MIPFASAEDVQLLFPDNNVSSKPIIEFRARDAKLDGGQIGGHAFVFLGREYDNGNTVFDVAAGFFPKVGEGLVGLKRFAITPGKVDYTILDIHSDVIFRLNISTSQEEKVKEIIKKYNEKDFGAFYRNCVTMTKEIADALGLVVPFSALDFGQEMPGVFIRQLKGNNDQDAPLRFEKKQIDDALERQRKLDGAAAEKKRKEAELAAAAAFFAQQRFLAEQEQARAAAAQAQAAAQAKAMQEQREQLAAQQQLLRTQEEAARKAAAEQEAVRQAAFVAEQRKRIEAERAAAAAKGYGGNGGGTFTPAPVFGPP